jgi:hypothetical protein
MEFTQFRVAQSSLAPSPVAAPATSPAVAQTHLKPDPATQAGRFASAVIHQRILRAAEDYRRSEAELVELLLQIDDRRVYIERGHSSLFAYVVSELRLSASTAYNLICVARKSREIPELRQHLHAGKITLSNARKIVPVLKPENKSTWLSLASGLSHRALEKEVSRERPQASVSEKASYVNGERVRLEVGLQEHEMLKLRLVQDLLCQSKRRSVSLEETLSELCRFFLHRKDPVERAKRHRVRSGSDSVETDARGLAANEDEIARHRKTLSVKDQVSTPAVLSAASLVPDTRCNTPQASGAQGSDSYDSGSEALEIQEPSGRGSTVKSPHLQSVQVGKPVAFGNSSERLEPSPRESPQPTESLRPAASSGVPHTLNSASSSEFKPSEMRTPLLELRKARPRVPASLLHQVNFRDQRRCQHTLPDGKRCNQSRWVEVHHLKPVSQGGKNTLENLTTLCWAHHRYAHRSPDPS